MKRLQTVKPTAEQLLVIDDYQPGTLVIRGAAGSGKTTTALLRLRFVTRFWEKRKRDGFVEGPIRVTVFTYNRTLRGYIEELVRDQVSGIDADVEISTFGKWSTTLLGYDRLLEDGGRSKILELGASLGFHSGFLLDEVDYVLGRFLPDSMDDYLDTARQGRGVSPQMDLDRRQMLLDRVVRPYQEWKRQEDKRDWNDLAVALAMETLGGRIQIVVVDEAQDFSANQARAILRHLDSDHSATWILDTVQRIYPRHFTWKEVGVTVTPQNSRRLRANHRNTKQIAAFALPLLSSIDVTDDGTLPDFDSCSEEGALPVVVSGNFSAQMDYVVAALPSIAESDPPLSAAILHAAGGGWFSEVRRRLTAAGFEYAEITRASEWPASSVNVVLSTMHSAKGLEFDNVFIVGLNAEVTPHGADQGDSNLENYLRLLAMAIGRARSGVMLGYKSAEASDLIEYLNPQTYRFIEA